MLDLCVTVLKVSSCVEKWGKPLKKETRTWEGTLFIFFSLISCVLSFVTDENVQKKKNPHAVRVNRPLPSLLAHTCTIAGFLNKLRGLSSRNFCVLLLTHFFFYRPTCCNLLRFAEGELNSCGSVLLDVFIRMLPEPSWAGNNRWRQECTHTHEITADGVAALARKDKNTQLGILKPQAHGDAGLFFLKAVMRARCAGFAILAC